MCLENEHEPTDEQKTARDGWKVFRKRGLFGYYAALWNSYRYSFIHILLGKWFNAEISDQSSGGFYVFMEKSGAIYYRIVRSSKHTKFAVKKVKAKGILVVGSYDGYPAFRCQQIKILP